VPVPVAPRSKPRVYDDSLAGIVGSSPAGEFRCVSCECCVLSGRGLWDGPITRPEESYRVSCVSMSVIDEPHRAMRQINMKLNSLLVERSTVGSFYWGKTYVITKIPSGFRVDTRPQKDGVQTRLPHKVFSVHFIKNTKITSIFFFRYRVEMNDEVSFCGLSFTSAWPSCGL